LFEKGGINGTTNSLFETKEGVWWDVCGSLFKGKVIYGSKLKVSGKDLLFIHDILENIKNGKTEKWVST
jgi:hypothetical protein